MRAPAFWSGRTLLSTLLLPLGAVYAAAGKLRRMAVRPQKAPVPVICVGNLVAGGAGKHSAYIPSFGGTAASSMRISATSG